jgi:hypothetical protein
VLACREYLAGEPPLHPNQANRVALFRGTTIRRRRIEYSCLHWNEFIALQCI